jgi:hypothetical protein
VLLILLMLVLLVGSYALMAALVHFQSASSARGNQGAAAMAIYVLVGLVAALVMYLFNPVIHPGGVD